MGLLKRAPKCPHEKWGTVGFAFNKPISTGLSFEAIYQLVDHDQEDAMQIWHGFTVVTVASEACGSARSYRTAGQTQA